MATEQEILDSMLSNTSNNYDKREGSFIYDALAPSAQQFAKTSESIDEVKKKLSIENLKGEELRQRVKERTGIPAKDATHAKGYVTVTGTGTINIGDLFETSGGIQFRATETKNIITMGTVKVEAVTKGASGNVPANTINLFPITIPGFTSVNNPLPTTDGFEAETDQALLQRYYERIQTPATSGNKAQYKNWAKEVQGVGEAKVFPLWNGNNTVKIVIINVDKESTSTELINSVQDYIDPNSEGLGEGQAPIGAYCTVISATEKIINVEFSVTLEPGYTLYTVKPIIESNLINYLRSISFNADIVSHALIGAHIINSENVIDYSNLTINSGTANILLSDEETPVLGSVVINA